MDVWPDGVTRHSPRDSACLAATIKPKVMVINAFGPEASTWYSNFASSGLGDLLALNITVPGLSPLYPSVHCTLSGDVCQMTVGESEVNAAASVSALVYQGTLVSSPIASNATTTAAAGRLDLTDTYFLGAGIAGVNPKQGTLGGVALARHVVQVALQYELDVREAPADFPTGYFAFDTDSPDAYPATLYGTEVVRLNTALGDAAADLAAAARLNDSAGAAAYRDRYRAASFNATDHCADDDKCGGGGGGDPQLYAPATSPPAVTRCDFATSDVYYSGTLLSEAFENTTMVWTNQTNVTYCMTAQEDAAVLHVLLRAQLAGLVDFSRAIMLRTGSNFDRPPPGVSAFDHLRTVDQNGFELALQNMYLAGIEIVKGIVYDWDAKYAQGIKPTDYIGDIFGSLGGQPSFGPGSVFGGQGAKPDGSTHTGLARRSNGRPRNGRA